ncbi:MAG: hypothetical protein R3D03_13605 [Geminicoccaceae bacterium]
MNNAKRWVLVAVMVMAGFAVTGCDDGSSGAGDVEKTTEGTQN